MPTILQEKLADEIVKNVSRTKPKNKKQLVVSSGYSEITGDRHASEVLEQKGVKEALFERGFNTQSAKAVVENILHNTKIAPATRLKAADQVFKVEGAYAPDKSINVNITEKSIDPTDPKVLEAIKLINKQRANG